MPKQTLGAAAAAAAGEPSVPASPRHCDDDGAGTIGWSLSGGLVKKSDFPIPGHELMRMEQGSVRRTESGWRVRKERPR